MSNHINGNHDGYHLPMFQSIIVIKRTPIEAFKNMNGDEYHCLTPCGLVMPYSDMGLGLNWLR